MTDKIVETIIDSANKLRDMNTPKPLIPTEPLVKPRQQRQARKDVSTINQIVWPEHPDMTLIDNAALAAILAGLVVSGMALGMVLK